MASIKSLQAKEILDSRGNPTIQVTLTLDNDTKVETSVSNGIRRYPSEAFVLYDQNIAHMDGKGVQKAVTLINDTIAPSLVGQDPTQQAQIDQWLLQLDATPQKTQVGANTMSAVSQALLKAGALASQLPLYQYLMNQYHLTEFAAIPTCLYGLINGGQYGSSGNLDIQEFLIIPASHIDYKTSLEIENALRGELQQLLKERKANYSEGELGGFTPYLQKNTHAFDFINEASRKTSYVLTRDFFLGVDIGADNLAENGKYLLKDRPSAYAGKELIEYYKSLREQYRLTYYEDPFTSKDTAAWQNLTTDLSDTTRIAADLMTATNPELVQRAVHERYGNTLVVKPSQIGTITETIEAIKTAREGGWAIVISQRTGETNDDFLADLAVGVGAEFVKFGPTNRGEAVAKYNRLTDIYHEIEKNSVQGAVMQTTNPTPNQATAVQPTDTSTAPAADMPLPTTPPEPTTPAPAPITPPAEPMPMPQPAQPLAEPAVPTQPTDNQPPASTPTGKPVAATDAQKAIDNTLAELGSTVGQAATPATNPSPTPPPATDSTAKPVA